jgi:hypothetical protein
LAESIDGLDASAEGRIVSPFTAEEHSFTSMAKYGGHAVNISTIPTQTTGWAIEPFADLSAAFVFFDNPVRLIVLDRLTWYVLTLCDGRSEYEIVAKVRSLGQVSAAERLVANRLGILRDRGLLAATS